MFCNLGYKNMGYKNTYTLREREKERVTKTKGPLGYKNKEREKKRRGKRELQKQGNPLGLQKQREIVPLSGYKSGYKNSNIISSFS